MNDSTVFQSFQKMMAQQMESAKPSDYIIGKVESVSPVVIRISQKETITEEFLVFTDLVRDFSVDIEVNHVTENRAGGGGYAEYESHNHDYKGRKKITVYNGLKAGESVVLIRQGGGQEYVVLSRIFDHIGLSGQWG